MTQPDPAPGAGPANVRMCVHCGQDCSGRPRVKDAQGRYACQPCLDARRAGANRGAGDGGADGGRPSGTDPPAHQPALTIDLLADEAAAPATAQPTRMTFELASEATAPPASLSPKPDPGLNRPGLQRQRAPRRCPSCGYDLAGLAPGPCPECGTINRAKTAEDHLADDSKAVTRWAYLRPMYMMLGGLAVMALLLIFLRKADAGAWIVAYGGWLASIPLGFVAFLVASYFWLGHDAPWPLTLLRLGATFALVEAASLLFDGIVIFSWLVSILVLFSMLVQEFEMDYGEALIMMVVNWGLWVLCGVLLVALVIGAA